MSIAYKDQLVYEALQDMDKYRQEQEVIFQRIREKKAQQPSVWEQIRIMRNDKPYSDDEE